MDSAGLYLVSHFLDIDNAEGKNIKLSGKFLPERKNNQTKQLFSVQTIFSTGQLNAVCYFYLINL